MCGYLSMVNSRHGIGAIERICTIRIPLPLLCFVLATSCAVEPTTRLHEPFTITSADPIYVDIEFDPIDLAGEFREQLNAHGFSVAYASKSQARFLLTGSYSATYDVSHFRMDWSQFKLIDTENDRTVYTMPTADFAIPW